MGLNVNKTKIECKLCKKYNMTKILVLLYGIRRVFYANHTPYAIFIRLDSVVRRFLPASLPTRGFHLEYCRILLRPDSRGGVEGMADDGERFC